MISVFKDFYDVPDGLSSDKDKLIAIESIRSDNTDNLVWLSAAHPERRDTVVQALKRLYHNKCAYCESPLDRDDFTIEQYRPKNLYPWLADEWSNLLPACRECNQAKEYKFEVSNTPVSPKSLLSSKLSIRETHQADSPFLRKEEPLLLHPEVDSPENHITFDSQGLAIGRTERGRHTINTCNLNRIQLIEQRKSVIRNHFFFVQILLDSLLHELPEIKRHKSFYEYIREELAHLYPDIDRKAPFSRLHQVIWEDYSMLITDYLDDKDKWSEFLKFLREKGVKQKEEELKRIVLEESITQMSRWKEAFLAERNQIVNPIEHQTKLLDFHIQNLEGIRRTSLENISYRAKWIFLTGENGYGKSSILKGIAAGLWGQELDNDEGRIKITLLQPSEEKGKGYAFKEYIYQSDKHQKFDKVVAYGASRLTMAKSYGSSESAVESLFTEQTPLQNIERYIADIYDRPKLQHKYTQIVNALERLSPHNIEVQVDDSQDIPVVKYYEKDDNGNKLHEVSFHQLATGIKSIIAMVGDILCHFMINKDVPDSDDGSILISGIVIIDEIDLHLHPKWQKKLPSLLSEVFPKVQFIASTHSPIPLLGAPEHSVFLKVNRTVEEGVTVERLEELEKDLPNLLPNAILSSGLFDLELFPITHDPSKPIYTENTYQEVKESQVLDEELHKLGKNFKMPNLDKDTGDEKSQ